MAAAVQAVKEAKQSIKANLDENVQAQAETKDVSAQLLAKFFRKASARSMEMAKARLTMEAAVKKAEHILLEKKRTNMARVASVEEQAEALAEELYHRPGSLLSKDELAHIYSELEGMCEDVREDIDCDTVPFADSIRAFDGSCNNREEPARGASFTAFRRLLPAHYEDGLMQLNGFRQSKLEDNMFRDGPFTPPHPSARLVSSTIIRDRPINAVNLTHLAMQWGAFAAHDFSLTVEFPNPNCDVENCVCTDVCAPVQVPGDDQSFGVGTPRNGSCLPFSRTLAACSSKDFQPRTQVNEITHYLDGSVIYGSTKTRARFLREFSGGRLKVGKPFPEGSGKDSLPEIPPCPPGENSKGEETPAPDNCCPPGFSTCFVAGDVRANEEVSFVVIHTIWLREHNRIAAALSTLNPEWDDERLYQESRKIVSAQLEQITLYEFLPVILGKTFFDKLIGAYPGYQPDRDSSIPNSFSTAAYRFGHTLIQDTFARLGPDYEPNDLGPLRLVESFMNPQGYFDSQGTDPIVRGWFTQPARAFDEFVNSVLTNQLFERDAGMGLDLATLNIQRSRDHGLPPYPVWKSFCEKRFPELRGLFEFSNELTKIRFLQTYGALDTLDLWPGGLAEEVIPGGMVGPTFACIFAITFSDLRNGDRFWYENTDPQIFTPAQLAEIRKTSLARVLCDNGDAISTIQRNPFVMGNRVPCFLSIPGINFAPWEEDPLCYQRVRVEPHTRDLDLFFFSILSNGDVRNYQLNLDGPSTTAIERCIPFVCPTELASTQVANFPPIIENDITNFVECRFTANAGLPPSQAPPGSESVYFAIWNPSTVQASNGLFQSLSSCTSSSNIAITYDCQSPASKQSHVQSTASMKSYAELESELAHILQAGGSSGGSNSAKDEPSTTFLPLYDVTLHRDLIPLSVWNVVGGGNQVVSSCELIMSCVHISLVPRPLPTLKCWEGMGTRLCPHAMLY